MQRPPVNAKKAKRSGPSNQPTNQKKWITESCARRQIGRRSSHSVYKPQEQIALNETVFKKTRTTLMVVDTWAEAENTRKAPCDRQADFPTNQPLSGL